MRNSAKGPLRILLIAPFGAGNHYWGPGISAYNLYQSETNREYSVTLLHGSVKHSEERIFQKEIFISDFDGTILSTIRFLYNIRKWIDKHVDTFDAVHALTAYHYSFLPALWCERRGVPSYIKLTSSNAGFSESSVMSRIIGLHRFRVENRNNISGYIAISNDIVKELIEAGIDREKIYSIPNGVNVKRFVPIDVEKKKELRTNSNLRNELTFLFVGSMTKRKRPALIVRAFAEMRAKFSCQLILIGPVRGDSGEMELVNKLISDNKLEEDIIVRGYTTDIVEYYQVSDVFILPSEKEGMSNALLEALSTGVPAIVTNVSGTSDLIDNYENGIIIEPNVTSLVNAMVKLSNDEIRVEFSRKARIKIVENYSSDWVLSQHLRLFDQ